MKLASERIGQWTVGSALGLVLLCALVRPEGLWGAAAGAGVAVVSAFVMARLVRALMTAGENARAVFALLLMGKSFLILGATAAFLFFGHVDVVGFALGVSALVTGVLGGTTHAFLTEPAAAAAGSSSDAKGAV
jgi:hypothetical protein